MGEHCDYGYRSCTYQYSTHTTTYSVTSTITSTTTTTRLLTILAIDHMPGLQVRPRSTGTGTGIGPGPDTAADDVQQDWIDVPAPEEGEFSIVVNLGDMLEKLTRGRYRSTPHRVKNMNARTTAAGPRFSFPLFYDPSWDASLSTLPLPPSHSGRGGVGIQRWDHADVHAWEGNYGTYLTSKVSKCFPELFEQTIDADAVQGSCPDQCIR